MKIKDLLGKYRVLVLLVAFVIAISIADGRFLQTSNLLNVLRQTSISAIIAAGMTFAILTGGIDISVGSTLAFSGAIAAWMVTKNYSIWAVIPVALLIGLAAGLFNGILVARAKLQPFIATLVTQTLLRGVTLVFTKGVPISYSSSNFSGSSFKWIGAGTIGPIPVPVILMLLVFAVLYFVLDNMAFGRYVYSIGGNEEASLLSGVKTKRVKTIVYIISGLTAAIAGVIVTSRLSSAQPNAGEGYELDAIAAVVLGGTSMLGGEGNILGTIVGALLIGVLGNALNLMDISSYYQTIIKGLVILVAVLLDKKEK